MLKVSGDSCSVNWDNMDIIVKSTSKNQNKVCGIEPEENRLESLNSKPLVYISFADKNQGIMKNSNLN